MLEKSQLFRPEDILVSQMISAIICDFPFIAGKQFSVVWAVCTQHEIEDKNLEKELLARYWISQL